ncbi:MAG: hypothetical protein KG075_17255 [Alphaproteobacteria bacterium]|nr:hypothetical protein [Alphaproteobacteria bacterium]
MSVIATAVRHLMAAGVTGDALLSAIAEMEDQIRNEPKARSSGAIRQERYRRNKASQSSQSVTSDVCNAPLSLPPNENISNPPTHTPGNNTPARKGAGPAKPDGVQDQTWRDFVAHRKAKRAAINETALAGIRREAEKAGWTLEAALAETVSRGWQGFKADWVGPAKPAQAENSYLDRLIAKSSAPP